MKKRHIISVTILLIGVALAAFVPIKFLINFAHDDSFFYLKTADNYAQGFGATFDRINTTNGFHPLWFFVLTTIFYFLHFLSQGSPETIYRVVFLLDYSICLATLFIVYRPFPKSDGSASSPFKFHSVFNARLNTNFYAGHRD